MHLKMLFAKISAIYASRRVSMVYKIMWRADVKFIRLSTYIMVCELFCMCLQQGTINKHCWYFVIASHDDVVVWIIFPYYCPFASWIHWSIPLAKIQ